MEAFEMVAMGDGESKIEKFKNEWELKLQQHYGSASVDKGLMMRFETLKMPRFVSEYIASTFIDKYGMKEGLIKIEEFLSLHYPKPNSTDLLHYKIQTEGEIVIIDNFKVSVHIEKHGNDHILTIPSLNIKNAKIEDHNIIFENPRLLSSGLWGLGKVTRTDDAKRAILSKFKPFQVASIDLQLYKEKRANFSTHEWLNILISTIGFNPEIFTTIRAKLIMLSRLLPLIQKSTFLFEFGKPGTGKTYIFDKLSNNSFVISGSKITPAKLFKDCQSRQEGLLRQYEAILFDEIDKINNSDFEDEIVNKLLKFMESNSFDRCGEEMMSDTSLIFSGNLPRSSRDNNIPNFFEPLAMKLKGEAFLDRFNGVIPGWEIKPLSNVNDNFSSTQGFSADYFSAILSELRSEDIEAKIESMLDFSDNTTNRDSKAIIKSISGFFKLIFPNMEIDRDIAEEIVDFCVELRQYIINERFELYGNQEDQRILSVRVEP
jgi:ATP-dependent Lon protease